MTPAERLKAMVMAVMSEIATVAKASNDFDDYRLAGHCSYVDLTATEGFHIFRNCIGNRSQGKLLAAPYEVILDFPVSIDMCKQGERVTALSEQSDTVTAFSAAWIRSGRPNLGANRRLPGRSA
jgi:hypothetical protein